MNIIDLVNAGTNAILLFIIIVLWRELLKCRADASRMIEVNHRRIETLTAEVAELKQRMETEQIITSVIARTTGILPERKSQPFNPSPDAHTK